MMGCDLSESGIELAAEVSVEKIIEDLRNYGILWHWADDGLPPLWIIHEFTQKWQGIVEDSIRRFGYEP